MAIEISEIGIRMQVLEQAEQQETQQTGSSAIDREKLVEDCVRRVLQALKTIGER